MVNEIIEIEISGLTHQGMGVGRKDGLAVFVADTIPGETVRARIVRRQKNYAVAERLAVLQPSVDRLQPACRYNGICGGCSLQHVRYARQLLLKRNLVEDTLRRIGGFREIVVPPVVPAPEALFYRNRAQFHLQWQEGGAKLGFFDRGGHRVADIASCLLLAPALNTLLTLCRAQLQSFGQPLPGLRHIVLQQNEDGGALGMVWIVEKDDAAYDRLAASFFRACPQLGYLALNINPKATLDAVYSEHWRLLGGKGIVYWLGDLRFDLSPGSFVQVNHCQMQALYAQVLDYADLQGTETVVDLYAGVGTISLHLARAAAQVLAVEEFAPAALDGRRNAARNGICNVEFFAAPAELQLPLWAEQGKRVDLLVLDPPRQGAKAAVLAAIGKIAPGRIVYVSCDPATLARDLRMLAEQGYVIEALQPFDMFPQTTHVETVVLLSKGEIDSKKGRLEFSLAAMDTGFQKGAMYE